MNITVNNYEDEEKKRKPQESNGGKALLVLTIVAMIGAIAYVGFVREPKSAYDVAVENGFKGTEAEWLESLKGSNGSNGTNGENGSTPTVEINSDGYWVINGQATTIKAQGDKGEQGDAGSAGSNGTNGTTPTVEINSDGYWVVNGVATTIKAQGDKGNAGTDGQDGANGSSIAEQTIANLNTKLAAITESLSSYPTVYDRLNAANISNDSLSRLTRNFLYSFSDNKFICVDDAGYVAYTVEGTNYQKADLCLSDVNLFQFNDSSSVSVDYSNYIISGTATTITTNKSLDVGNNTYFETINYINDAAVEGQTAYVRTNGGALTINAPKDVVNHYGTASSTNIIAVANSSYHEFGSVAKTEIKQGRVVIEEGGQMDSIHLSKTGTTFNNIVISIEEEVKAPLITRDEVGTTITGNVLVCEIEKAGKQSDFIYLSGNGTKEQIKVATGASTITGATPAEVTTESVTGDDENLNVTTALAVSALANESDGAGGATDTGMSEAEKEVMKNSAARIGGVYYTTLKEALDAALNDDTVYLLENVKEAKNANFTESYVVDNKKVTIEGFNTPTIEVDQSLTLFTVNDGGVLTISNVIFDGQAKFERKKDGLNSSVGTPFESKASATQYSDKPRSKSLIITNKGGTLNIGKGTTFMGFDYTSTPADYYTASGCSIIRVYGEAGKTTLLNIDGATFKENIGKTTTLIAITKCADCVINDTIIKDNSIVQNANHGLICVSFKSTVTFKGNTEICGNSYNGNGLISGYSGSEADRNYITIENIYVHENYGGHFRNGYFASTGYPNGRSGLFYVHKYTSLIMNGGTIEGNEVWASSNWGDEGKYGNLLTSPIDIYGKTSYVEINGGTIQGNYFVFQNGTRYEAAVSLDLTTEFPNGDYDGQCYKQSENAVIKGYVGNLRPRKIGSTYTWTTPVSDIYCTETLEEQSIEKLTTKKADPE